MTVKKSVLLSHRTWCARTGPWPNSIGRGRYTNRLFHPIKVAGQPNEPAAMKNPNRV
jgi:hypothetical protein